MRRTAARTSVLAGISFLEASVFPIPADVLLIPMVLADRKAAWRIAGICTLASVLGGLAGYGIGYLLFELIGRPILEFYGFTAAFAEAQAMYHEWGIWIVAAGAITPMPYKVVTIASGVAQLDLATFLLVSIVSRGFRYYVVAGVVWYFGPPIRKLVERNLGLATTAFFALLIGGFVVVKYAI